MDAARTLRVGVAIAAVAACGSPSETTTTTTTRVAMRGVRERDGGPRDGDAVRSAIAHAERVVGQTWRVLRTYAGRDGTQHVRLQQQVAGLDVRGSDIVVHVR